MIGVFFFLEEGACSSIQNFRVFLCWCHQPMIHGNATITAFANNKTEVKLLLVLLQCPSNVTPLITHLYISIMSTHAIMLLPFLLFCFFHCLRHCNWHEQWQTKENKAKTIATAISTRSADAYTTKKFNTVFSNNNSYWSIKRHT